MKKEKKNKKRKNIKNIKDEKKQLTCNLLKSLIYLSRDCM